MRRNLLLGFSAAVLAGVLAMPAPARADVITYNDLTDSVSLSHVGTDTTITGGCPADENPCGLLLTRGNQTVVSTTIPGGGNFSLAEDPQLQIFSDQIVLNISDLDFLARISFVSLPGEGASSLCSQGAPCQAQETGLPQGGTITWSGGGVDSIFIQSDPEPGSTSVPEPGTLALLAAALAGLGLTRRRRRSWQERDRG